MAHPIIEADECIACGVCVDACPAGVLELNDVATVTDEDSCVACGACQDACPAGAITKREDGTVIADQSKCLGCQACQSACPYGVPQYREDDGTMIKCDGCADRRAVGLQPACAHTCFYNALYAGPLSELEALAAERGAERMEGETGPSIFVAGL